MAEINERLCVVIAKSGYLLNTVVEKTGINLRSLSNYKNSTEIPSSALAKIIKALDVNPDYLLFGKDPIFRNDAPSEQTKRPSPIPYVSDDDYTPKPYLTKDVEELQKRLAEAESRIDTLTQTTNIQAATIAALVNNKSK